jgi:hypothetical protein
MATIPIIYSNAFSVTFNENIAFNKSREPDNLAIFEIDSPDGTIGVGQETYKVLVTKDTFTEKEPLILPLVYNHFIYLLEGTKCKICTCAEQYPNRHYTARNFEIMDGLLGFSTT